MVQAPDMEVAHPDLPQALALLGEMNVSAQHVATLVDNMLQRVRNGELSTDQGLSFLEMKYNMLLSYLINLTFVVLRKCSGETIEGDPCISRLVEIRTVLEKIRPIDNKLKYQINKLVKTAASGNKLDDPTTFKANPDDLMSGGESSEDESETEDSKAKAKEGIYIPPKLSAVHYTGDESVQERNKRIQERSKKHALSSTIMDELREEYLDNPTEMTQGTQMQKIMDKRVKEQTDFEEEYFVRLPQPKSDRTLKKRVTTISSLTNEILDFGDGGGGVAKKRKAFKSKGKPNKRKRIQ
ncbi:PREDICTED: neuroguidin-B [Nicrophorus vespilloides]|uniref:Neuroguidin-B n=1 Tax=Nicrophorus vespilloides TaxID=110193 RepID=A0ABM1M4M8_NICVS|nr:PREDICTED: neuroguidin-B [Nicrophorus vespilloides]